HPAPVAAPSDVGKLLDWCALCGISLPGWDEWRALLLTPALLDLRLGDLCAVAQGVHRYDGAAYEDWVATHRNELVSYAKLHTNTIDLTTIDDVLHARFLVDTDDARSANDQAVERLIALRRLLPFYSRYDSDGTWLLPFGVKPPNDDTHK